MNPSRDSLTDSDGVAVLFSVRAQQQAPMLIAGVANYDFPKFDDALECEMHKMSSLYKNKLNGNSVCSNREICLLPKPRCSERTVNLLSGQASGPKSAHKCDTEPTNNNKHSNANNKQNKAKQNIQIANVYILSDLDNHTLHCRNSNFVRFLLSGRYNSIPLLVRPSQKSRNLPLLSSKRWWSARAVVKS